MRNALANFYKLETNCEKREKQEKGIESSFSIFQTNNKQNLLCCSMSNSNSQRGRTLHAHAFLLLHRLCACCKVLVYQRESQRKQLLLAQDYFRAFLSILCTSHHESKPDLIMNLQSRGPCFPTHKGESCLTSCRFLLNRSCNDDNTHGPVSTLQSL